MTDNPQRVYWLSHGACAEDAEDATFKARRRGTPELPEVIATSEVSHDPSDPIERAIRSVCHER